MLLSFFRFAAERSGVCAFEVLKLDTSFELPSTLSYDLFYDSGIASSFSWSSALIIFVFLPPSLISVEPPNLLFLLKSPTFSSSILLSSETVTYSKFYSSSISGISGIFSYLSSINPGYCSRSEIFPSPLLMASIMLSIL